MVSRDGQGCSVLQMEALTMPPIISAIAQLCLECQLFMPTHSVGRQIGKGALVQHHP